MNKEELVSIIMSCYNEKIDWVRKSIESILNQSYKNIEFIIINDNPEYEELKNLLYEYEKKDKRVRLYFNQENKGLIYSLNKALEITRGNYIARMDADDISYPNRINDEMELLKSDKVDFVMSNADIMDEYENRLNNFNNFKLTSEKVKDCLKYRNVSIHPTWMFKKHILQKLKGYNEVLYAEDYDFLCRVVLNNYNVEYLDKPLIKYRVRISGISKSKKYYQEIVSQIVNENYRQALKNINKYNPSECIDKLDEKTIEKFKVNNMKFEKAKELMKSNKKIIGFINILLLLFISKIKRKEMINKFWLNCVCRFN